MCELEFVLRVIGQEKTKEQCGRGRKKRNNATTIHCYNAVSGFMTVITEKNNVVAKVACARLWVEGHEH